MAGHHLHTPVPRELHLGRLGQGTTNKLSSAQYDLPSLELSGSALVSVEHYINAGAAH